MNTDNTTPISAEAVLNIYEADKHTGFYAKHIVIKAMEEYANQFRQPPPVSDAVEDEKFLIEAFEGMILHALKKNDVPLDACFKIVESINRKMKMCGLKLFKEKDSIEPATSEDTPKKKRKAHYEFTTFLAAKVREHLNAVGYELSPDTEKLIRQVLEIDGGLTTDQRTFIEPATKQNSDSVATLGSSSGNSIEQEGPEPREHRSSHGSDSFVL